jgi:anti-sigma factor RsiW
MDSHDRYDRLLTTFLAGELDPAEARRWDEHLLECETCWRAVREERAGRQAAQVLRQPAPAGLADRVAFAVEVAAAGQTAARRHGSPPARSSRWARSGGWLRWPRLAGAGTVAVAVLVMLVVFLLPGGHQTRSVPAAVAAVATYAQAVPPPARDQHSVSGGRAAAVEVGQPVTVTAGGQKIVLRTWRLDGTEAVVAVSSKPFPRPARAQGVAGSGMAWSARLGRLGLYCLNGRTSELVAAPVPAAELAALAARLPLA